MQKIHESTPYVADFIMESCKQHPENDCYEEGDEEISEHGFRFTRRRCYLRAVWFKVRLRRYP